MASKQTSAHPFAFRVVCERIHKLIRIPWSIR